MNLVCRPWVKTDDYLTTRWELIKAVKLRFDAEGITIPFPQQDVHFHPAGAASVPEEQEPAIARLGQSAEQAVGANPFLVSCST